MNNRNKEQSDIINLDKIEFDLEKLGEGAYAIVRKAFMNKNEFAIKEILIDDEDPTLDDCEKEKNIMKEITLSGCKGIVKYVGYSFDSANSKYYIMMEFMNSGTLYDTIHTSQNKPFEWGTKLNLMRNVASGVELLHKYNIVHYDISSNNTLLSGDLKMGHSLTAKLSDFGRCRRTSESYGLIGRPRYTAPEVIIGGGSAQTASDIFSLAILLWETGAWRFPHKNLSALTILSKVTKDGLREKIPNDFPKRYANLVTWGWSQKPDKRPTATEVVNELTAIEKEIKISMHKN